MTTIAYKSGVVAADSQETHSDGRKNDCQKLYKMKDGTIIATAGDSYTGLIFVEWFKEGARKESIPDLTNITLEEDFECLVLENTENIYIINRFFQKYHIEMPEGFYSLGWGAPYAVAAMHMGADAKKAVQVAAKYDAYTGGTVKTMKVKRPKSTKQCTST